MVTISLCGSGDENDTVVWVYRGNCDGYPIAWNDDSPECGNLNSKIENIPMPAGTTYYIVIAGYGYSTVDYVLNVTSVPLVTGACCFCDATCMETCESDCTDRAGTYQGDGTYCWSSECTYQPPPNDDCESVTPVTLSNGVPEVFTGHNACSTNDCGMVSGPQVWIAFTITELSDVDISYCGTWPTQTTVSVWMFDACPCDADYYAATTSGWDCPDGSVNFHGTWKGLAPGTYYYGVQTAPGAEGPYYVTVTATVPVYGACCLCDGACAVVMEEDCAAEFGAYYGDNTTCEQAGCTPYLSLKTTTVTTSSRSPFWMASRSNLRAQPAARGGRLLAADVSYRVARLHARLARPGNGGVLRHLSRVRECLLGPDEWLSL